MAKPFIPTDLASLKPVVEAMIFASEEPLGPRTLLRLLFEEEKKGNGQDKNGEGTLFEGADSDAGEKGADAAAGTPSFAEEAETEPAAAPDDASGETNGEEAEIDSETHSVGEQNAEEGKGAKNETEEDEDETEELAGQSVEGKEEREEKEEGKETNGAEEGGEDPNASPEPENPAPSSGGKSRADAPETPSSQIGQKELRTIIDELNEEYEMTGRPFRIIEIAGGFQFATTREYGEFVGLLARDKMRRKLSPAALETLAIVAYRQPVTKPEVEAIRGVNCDQVLFSLLERNLLAITGRAETVGKPLLYGTTEEFLRAFGLNSLNDLPKLRELEELMEEDAHSPTKPEIIPEQIADRLLELNLPEGEEPGNGEIVGTESGENKEEDKEREGEGEETEGVEMESGEDEGEEKKENEGEEEEKESEGEKGENNEREEEPGNGEREKIANEKRGEEGSADEAAETEEVAPEMNEPSVDAVESVKDEEGGGEAVEPLSP